MEGKGHFYGAGRRGGTGGRRGRQKKKGGDRRNENFGKGEEGGGSLAPLIPVGTKKGGKQWMRRDCGRRRGRQKRV